MSILKEMNNSTTISVQPITFADRNWIEEFYFQRWGSGRVVTRGTLYTVAELPGFIAWKGDTRIGLLTYRLSDDAVEIVTFDSVEPGRGIGTALILEMIQFTRVKKHQRLWLITTNDNTPALRFYQKIGFQLVKIHQDAVQTSRELKPEIPFTGLDGIPIRDEIELEYPLS
jgi:GNAT superfamily N-acetyltransferase